MITVIIPTHNMASYLPEAAESVFSNTCENIELFIVDDGSVDNTPEVIEKIKDPNTAGSVHYIKTKHRGKAAAINKVLTDIKGSYVTILDADDKLPEGSLQVRYQRAEETGCELVLGGFLTFNKDQILSYRSPPEISDNKETLIDKLLFNIKSPFHQNSMLIAGKLIKRAGFYDERLFRAQDKDYAIRLIREANAVEIIEKPVYMYRRYKRGYLKRLRNRLRTIRYKTTVILKHSGGLKRIVALIWSVIVEVGKMGYELFTSYKK